MKRRAAVLNRYLGTWGGGERVTFAVANELAGLGFDVDVITDERVVPTLDEVHEAFGPGHDGFAIKGFGNEEALKGAMAEYSVLINQCAGNTYNNVSPLGVYFVMFPFQDAGGFLDSYHYFVCNSEFTRHHTLTKWGKDLTTEVIYPGAELGAVPEVENKEKIILTVGRFNVSGHTKNQRALLDAFLDSFGTMPRGWTLHLLGRLNPGPETSEYVDELERICQDKPVKLHINATEAQKRDLLARASIYWHATGWNRTEPYAMEHFGISVVEAMGAGAVPICYGHGGPEEIITFGESGYLFEDRGDLLAYTRLLACDEPRLRKMQRAAAERAQSFSRRAFSRNFRAFLKEVMA